MLIVEDNDADVFLIKKALRDYAIRAEVTVCTDGESAIQYIDSRQADRLPDAMILDLSVPRIEGLDILRNILSRPALVGMPVMIFSSSPSPADRHRAQLLGSLRYIQKPSDVDRFLQEVADNVNAMFLERAKGARA
ncbi:MAG: response regulator [Bryobacteraceae bacterium]